MITLSDLAALAADHPEALADLSRPVAPLRLGERVIDTDARPAVMGVVNLSQDSFYRESLAPTAAIAVQMARVQTAQGADIIDLGAESSVTGTSRVDARTQIAQLVPVVEVLAADGITVSVESYDLAVVRACLAAGAQVVNLTGSAYDDEMFSLAAEFDATVVLCFVPGADVRELVEVDAAADPVPGMLDQLRTRLARAHDLGADRMVVDPGIGFTYYGNLTDPASRTRHQVRSLLHTFRLRSLGVPVCHALPHAFEHFRDEFRTAEGFFAVLAALGGTGVFRTHEVPKVRAVLSALGDAETG